jgi:hypothetical protein
MDIMKISGIIEAIYPRMTAKGTAYDIIIDGMAYSTFRPGNVKAGDTVDIEFIMNGSFRNIQKITVVPAKPTQTKIPEFSQPSIPKPATIANRRMDFFVCLKVAGAVLNGSKASPEEVRDYAKKLLDAIKDYI